MSVSEELFRNAGNQVLSELKSLRNTLAKTRIASLLAEDRHQDPKSLVRCGFKAYSQNDEDGILQEIFRRIGVQQGTFVEFGCGNNLENNTVYLLLQGWSGLWMDADPQAAQIIASRLPVFVQSGKLRFRQTLVTRENINELLAQEPRDLDLLSIDIDMNDFWVWAAIECIQPRVIAIEYNASIRPPAALVVPYRADHVWNRGNYFGASLAALQHLAELKGYALVGCGLAGVNAFFVRRDLLADLFAAPYTAERHYQPPAYSLFTIDTDSHPVDVGVYQVVSPPPPRQESDSADSK